MADRSDKTWAELLGGEPDAARALWDGAEGLGDDEPVDVDRGWAALSARLARGERAAAPARGPRLRRGASPKRWRRYAVAAAAAVVALVLVNVLSGDDATFRRYANDSADMEHVTLPDETAVMLMPGARFDFVARETTREVRLDGSARFDVREDPARPFTVDGRGYDLVVMGTSFDIHDGDPAVIAVTEGHVRLRGDREADWTDLFAGDSAEVADALVHPMPPARRDEVGVYDAAPLGEVVDDLRAAGLATIRVPDALAACTVSADFTDSTPAEIARALALLFDADLVEVGDTYRLRGGSCR